MGTATATVMPALVGLISFVVLFAAAVAALRKLQRRGRGPLSWTMGQGDVRVVRRQPIGWQTLLLVVQVGERQYVVTTTRGGAVTMLDKLDFPLPDTPGALPSRGVDGGVFAALLRRIQNKWDRAA